MRFSVIGCFGVALVSATLLVACGGGSTAIPSATSPGGGQAIDAKTSGTTLTIVIHRGSTRSHPRRASVEKTAVRSPKFVDGATNGLQLSVTAGASTQTLYVDLSSPSPLCTTAGLISTCTIKNVPTLAASETLVALETDAAPSGENATTGLGTSFPTGTNILGGATQTETLTLGGPNALALVLGEVSADFYDCMGDFTPPSGLPQNSTANFGFDTSGFNNAGGNGNDLGSRLVVTAGVATSGMIQAQAGNALCEGPGSGCNWGVNSGNGTGAVTAPFVDVNGSPTPVTVTSNSTAITLAPVVNNGTPPPPSAYATNVSIPDGTYYWDDGCVWLIATNFAATVSSTVPSLITLNNNLTAKNSYSTLPNYAQTMTYSVAAIAASPSSVTVAASGTATVTGTDQGAASGMSAESAYNAGGDGNCNSSGAVTLATVASAGPISTSNWQQAFTITAGSTTGTCTFYLFDTQAGTVTTPITVTIN